MISNNIDICFVSETWLHENISSEVICLNGYGMQRNDRTDVIASKTFEYLSCMIIFHRLVRSDHKEIVENPQSLAKPEGNMYVLAMFANTER